MENKTPIIQNERGHTLTEEQVEILKHIKHSNDDLKIKAFAGTGKTSTLRTIAEFTQKINYVYMAYNKAIQVEAQSTFPKNVSCKTAHSLAYNALGIWRSSYKEKLANKIRFTEYLDAISYKHNLDKFLFFHFFWRCFFNFCKLCLRLVSK